MGLAGRLVTFYERDVTSLRQSLLSLTTSFDGRMWRVTPSVPEIVRFFVSLEDDPDRRSILDGMPFQIFQEAVRDGLVDHLEQDQFAMLVGKAVGRGLLGSEFRQAGTGPPGAVWGDHEFQMQSGYFATPQGRELAAGTGTPKAATGPREPAGDGAVRDCFICHAGEDKDAVARPLAKALSDAGYAVWFDEYEMVVGDSLRQRIDEGLAGSRFGVVILSRRFFEKGWPQSELNGLFAKEMVGGERLILPVWHEIDEVYLAGRSPLLADRIGVPSQPLDSAADQVIRAIEHRKGRGASAAAMLDARVAPLSTGPAEPVELVKSGDRVRLGLTDAELETYAQEGGHSEGPGWLAVVVGPVRLQSDLIDPTEVPLERVRGVRIPDPWYGSPPLSSYLRVDHEGFWARLPEDRSVPPAYWMRIWQDGLMEYGTDLARKAGPMNPQPELVIPTTTVAELIHDNALLFMRILSEIGYRGEAAAVASFNGLGGHMLGVDRRRYWAEDLCLDVDRVDGRPLRGPLDELSDGIGRWTKKTMDRLFLAAGISSGYAEISPDGQRLDRNGRPVEP